MITYIEALNSKAPPMPGIPGGPGPPGLPIDNGVILLFFAAITLGTYMYFKNVQKNEKVKVKNSLF
ncbi:MAG: hypothetical protein ABJH82_08635 [Polaribacter sp.]|uniref:hypothetical protein n=1 Tax=Polaribacter sp. TaxID=1920175 RepID=UPI003264B871